ncbi:hypothetical protein BGZ61DRAFT_542669 [Ilyonectria robusta]|uniref:uncharacterized protein n=1 Tax=Ilyonectria robusta TaxID=1079257 RepID=UPI001E8C9D59|nr:uncharacterized protein BGZ61DRAFT_542669 [Ilyonectria robusta]KAH8645909.1 hypothetical protein BGZ61DRAFT_542669 [Ilyonectria robusta]
MDPLSTTLSGVTAAIQATKLLKNTVTRFKDRDKTLARLQDVVEDLSNILDVLRGTVDSGVSTALLEGPVSRCNQVCRDFATAMQAFGGKSKMGFRDWTKMEFMKGDINEFMDTLAGYKATISVGLGTITMQTSRLSHKVLEEYNEIIQDTIYNLEVHLRRIDEKLALFFAESRESAGTSGTNVNLRDERAVTEQCLRICQDARSYVESLADQGESLKHQSSPASADDRQSPFEAQLLTRRALDENRDTLSQTIGRIQERLTSMATSGTPESDRGFLQLQGELKTSKQCLALCKMASDQVAHQKVYRVGELVADGDSDQVVITTLADLFDVGKASSTNGSAQWIGSFSDETVRHVSTDRYSSRFGALVTSGVGDSIMRSTSNSRGDNSSLARGAGRAGQPAPLDTVQRRPSPNEMRKRATEADSEKECQ